MRKTHLKDYYAIRNSVLYMSRAPHVKRLKQLFSKTCWFIATYSNVKSDHLLVKNSTMKNLH